MAPARSSTRRGAHISPVSPTPPARDVHDDDPSANKELFLDPMLGTPLAIFIEKDVENKDDLSQLIIKNGGSVSPGYSGVTYILVDPHKPSGQNLWRQYAGKKGKIVLSAKWVNECIKANQLQTFVNNWAGCKVTGQEIVNETPRRTEVQAPPATLQTQVVHPHAIQAPMPPVDAALHAYQFQVYAPPGMQQVHAHPMANGPPRPWQVTIAPAQAHLHPPHPPSHIIHRPQAGPSQPHSQQYRDHTWNEYNPPDEISQQPTAYDYRYNRDEQGGWVPGPAPYYDPTYEQGYVQPPYMEEPEQPSGSSSGQTPHIGGNPVPGPSTQPEAPERTRGRKRTRTQPPPAAPAASLVVNRNPPARSPTPPTRIIKSTYGGNLFTAEDVLYLKKYIDYCQDQCLVLSLREICERIAVKAPHHTFYSWRRYCNKHQIRLGGYAMNHDRSESPTTIGEDMNLGMEGDMIQRVQAGSVSSSAGPAPRLLDMNAATAAAAAAPHRNRSPTPPRALFRSTTGKGVAFTQEDVTFLVRFMDYRKSQGALDMVAFWKDVAIKAPHHSRASWMKFWRRHKHELSRSEGDEPLPAPPDKKMRYSKEDDILLAKHFFNKPEGTSDKIFQAFGRLHPHHPWKGWQEHHRIHKTKIEHLIQLLAAGEDIDDDQMDDS